MYAVPRITRRSFPKKIHIGNVRVFDEEGAYTANPDDAHLAVYSANAHKATNQVRYISKLPMAEVTTIYEHGPYTGGYNSDFNPAGAIRISYIIRHHRLRSPRRGVAHTAHYGILS